MLSEREFEPWVERYVHRAFVRDVLQPQPNSLRWFIVNTALLGARSDRWSVPDLLLITVASNALAPQPRLEVVGFELKVTPNLDNGSLAQAAAEHESVHQVFVVALMQGALRGNTTLDALVARANHHKVGLITTTDPVDANAYTRLSYSQRRVPDDASLQRLLNLSLANKPSERQRLQAWLR